MTGRHPDTVTRDRHPGYATTRWAQRQGAPLIAVQHHHAHAVSLLAEHDRVGTPIIAVTLDGTGYGTDGSIWGGEFVYIATDPTQFTRVGNVAPFSLPGGDGAVRQPARTALDLLQRCGVPWDDRLAPVAAIGPEGVRVLVQQISRGIGCVATSSMGRLFDAVASLRGVCQVGTYEGQAAVELAHLARAGNPVALDFAIDDDVLNPDPVITGLVLGLNAGDHPADLAAGFHNAVIRATARVATSCAAAAKVTTIELTGGVFVNRILLSGVQTELCNNDFDILVHRVLPCNDGGIALGQAVIAATLSARH